ncbi:histidine kinase [Micromonospora sp. WMMD967]|uniref:sensor histidine kinase n=1 Tax=Micromonospora sp. WMMD967 TaxID=3016101 RepID=UPI00241608F7|nr:histidine kinase [Micromonospora sp. WMMD967]MDG4837561.1 histidine kinase [Micromonospora sp. WMMD967]
MGSLTAVRILDSSWPGWLDRRRRLLSDLLLWAVVAAPVGYAGFSPPYAPHAVPLTLAKVSLLGAAVVASRRQPLLAPVLVVLGSVVDGNFVFAIPVFSYLAGRRAASVGPAAGVFVLIVGGGTALNLGLLGTGAATWFLLASVLLFAAVFPWLVGRYRRQQQELADAGRRHVEASTREQRGAAERIRLRERARIAGEMHDSLGHDLSLIALRAAALEVAADLDDRHRAAAGELRASVSAATERLHEIIGVLREEGGASVRPSGETVAELVEGAREAGMAVRMEAIPAVAELPAMTGHAAHRIVREGLTNAARYAPGAPVEVSVTRAGDRVEVAVVNDAPPAGPLPAPPSQGSGLLALAERVRLAGGTLHAGPRSDGGFAVRAALPVTGPVESATGTGPVGPSDPALPDPALPDAALLDAALPDSMGEPGPSERPVDAERRLHDARRRVRRSLLVALLAPVGFALVLSLVYYPVATAGTVLDRATFEQMRLGTARSELAGLPRRQLERPTTADRDGCEYYTDGNFPLAQPTWRLCFTDGRLASKEWIAQ